VTAHPLARRPTSIPTGPTWALTSSSRRTARVAPKHPISRPSAHSSPAWHYGQDEHSRQEETRLREDPSVGKANLAQAGRCGGRRVPRSFVPAGLFEVSGLPARDLGADWDPSKCPCTKWMDRPSAWKPSDSEARVRLRFPLSIWLIRARETSRRRASSALDTPCESMSAQRASVASTQTRSRSRIRRPSALERRSRTQSAAFTLFLDDEILLIDTLHRC
jgi:hypothetical protein